MFTHKFNDGDSVAFICGEVDGVKNIPMLAVTRVTPDGPKQKHIALYDTDKGVDLVDDLAEALLKYIDKRDKAKAELAEETAKSLETK